MYDSDQSRADIWRAMFCPSGHDNAHHPSDDGSNACLWCGVSLDRYGYIWLAAAGTARALRRGVMLHPELGCPIPPRPELTDERLALMIAAAYDNAAYVTLQRLALSLTVGGDFARAHRSLGRRFGPDYTELRDYLLHECDVPLVLAARVALRLSTLVEVRS